MRGEQPGVLAGGHDRNMRLLVALAEELKLPLQQIAHKSQLMQITGDSSEISDIETTASSTLRLIDGYLFTTQFLLGQQELRLQPVSVGATMQDSAEYLRQIAKLYNCELEIIAPAKTGLVMAHREALRAAYISLAHTMIISSPQGIKNKVILQTYKDKDKIYAGVTSRQNQISKQSLAMARNLHGRARQPLASMTHGSGAGVYVADVLFGAMSQRGLKVFSHGGQTGLFASLLPSRQLALL